MTNKAYNLISKQIFLQNMTISEFCKKNNIPKYTINQLKNHKPSDKTILSIINALGDESIIDDFQNAIAEDQIQRKELKKLH